MEDDEKEEGEEGEESPADKARWDKVRKKTDAFMAEIGEDVLDEEAIEKTEEHTKALFKNRNLPYQTLILRAFIEGAAFSLGKERSTIMTIHMAQRVILKKMEARLKKTVETSLKGKPFGDK